MKVTAESGFSLAFVALFVTIAGIIGATFIVSAKRDSHWQPIRETQARMEKIKMALIAFQRSHKYLPCPAPVNVLSNHADYGVAATTCAGGHTEGAVPFRTLQLPEEYGLDMWEMKITYIMNSALSEPSGVVGASGTLTVETDSGTVTDVAYVLISHGKNGGGYHKNSTTRSAATFPTGVEQENRDGDDHLLSISHNYQQTTDYFDDIVIWGEVDKVARIP